MSRLPDLSVKMWSQLKESAVAVVRILAMECFHLKHGKFYQGPSTLSRVVRNPNMMGGPAITSSCLFSSGTGEVPASAPSTLLSLWIKDLISLSMITAPAALNPCPLQSLLFPASVSFPRAWLAFGKGSSNCPFSSVIPMLLFSRARTLYRYRRL